MLTDWWNGTSCNVCDGKACTVCTYKNECNVHYKSNIRDTIYIESKEIKKMLHEKYGFKIESIEVSDAVIHI